MRDQRSHHSNENRPTCGFLSQFGIRARKVDPMGWSAHFDASISYVDHRCSAVRVDARPFSPPTTQHSVEHPINSRSPGHSTAGSAPFESCRNSRTLCSPLSRNEIAEGWDPDPPTWTAWSTQQVWYGPWATGRPSWRISTNVGTRAPSSWTCSRCRTWSLGRLVNLLDVQFWILSSAIWTTAWAYPLPKFQNILPWGVAQCFELRHVSLLQSLRTWTVSCQVNDLNMLHERYVSEFLSIL